MIIKEDTLKKHNAGLFDSCTVYMLNGITVPTCKSIVK